jgi:hypothetical protein
VKPYIKKALIRFRPLKVGPFGDVKFHHHYLELAFVIGGCGVPVVGVRAELAAGLYVAFLLR